MSYQQWQWSCSACHEMFYGGTPENAEKQFLDHARAVHKPTTILSFNSEKGVGK